MDTTVPDRAAPAALLAGPSAPFAIDANDATRHRLVRWHREYGDVYCVPEASGSAASWVVHQPDLVQQILVRQASHYRKGRGLDRVRILLGRGIMVSEGDFWARQRRLIQPAFRPRALADFNQMIFEENQRLAKRWQAAAEAGQAVEVEAAVSELTLIIVLKSIFGVDYAQLTVGGDNPFALLTEEPTRDLRFAARFHRLKGVVEKIIERRMHTSAPEFDFLGHMLAARTRRGESMSHRALVDEVMTLIVAGHETTASALAFAWYLIASHPDVCHRLQAEADSADQQWLADTGGDRRRGGPALAYTDQVVAETLRLYPPGWLLSRQAIVDHELGGHAVAAGTQIYISLWLLHRHPDYWHNPERFDPDRFANRQEPGHRMAYLPFAAGPRHCVGEHLAAIEMRVHLATLLRRFTPKYLGHGEPRIQSAINLRPSAGIYLQLASR